MSVSRRYKDRQPRGDSFLLSDLTDQFEYDPDIHDTPKFRRDRRNKMFDFIAASESRDDLHKFATNWNWDGDVEPLFELIENPACDTGTLLFLFWYGAPEDYYFHEDEEYFDGDVYRLLVEIEKQFLQRDPASAMISFDPNNQITMLDGRDRLHRQIPAVMYLPVPGEA